MFNHYFWGKHWLHQSSHHSRVTEKVSLGFPVKYVEAYASRARFVYPHDEKIPWVHSVRFQPMLQHVTRSRGWNIIKRVNGNVGNEIELGIEIPMIKSRILQVSQKIKRIGHRHLWFNDKIPLCEYTGIITDIQIRLMIICRRGVSVMSGVFSNCRIVHLRVRWY
jgi:hypothetical protein